MFPQLNLIIFVIGIVVGFVPMFWWHSWRNDIREKEQLEAVIKQEKKNVEITSKYATDIAYIHSHYQSNPVRVFISRPDGKGGSTSCPDVTTKDIVLTVGGVKASDGAKTD